MNPTYKGVLVPIPDLYWDFQNANAQTLSVPTDFAILPSDCGIGYEAIFTLVSDPSAGACRLDRELGIAYSRQGNPAVTSFTLPDECSGSDKAGKYDFTVYLSFSNLKGTSETLPFSISLITGCSSATVSFSTPPLEDKSYALGDADYVRTYDQSVLTSSAGYGCGDATFELKQADG